MKHLLLALVFAATATTGAAQVTTTSSLAGTWTFELKRQGKVVGTQVVILRDDNGKLTGTVPTGTGERARSWELSGERVDDTFGFAFVVIAPSGIRAPIVFAGLIQKDGTLIGASSDPDSYVVAIKGTR